MGRRTESVLLALALAAIVVFFASFLRAAFAGEETPASAVADPPPERARTQEPEPRATVEVLNASGISGLARRATEQLREAGFDVLTYENARPGTPPDTSVVLDRSGETSRARAVADLLSIPVVRTEVDSTAMLDVTVILGRDWSGIEERR